MSTSVEPARRTPTSNELAAFKAALWHHRDGLRELGDLLQSIGVSISQAAYRGNDAALKHHIDEARLTVKAAIDAVNTLGETKRTIDRIERDEKRMVK